MSIFATYLLEVNWSGDDTTWVDETAYLLAIETRRGRDYASQLVGRATPGSLIVTLWNSSGRFSPFNTAGALYGSLLPGRAVRWRTTAPSVATLWYGFVDVIEPLPGDRDDFAKVMLRASGPLKWVQEKRASTATYTSLTTGVAVGYVLDDAAWPAGPRTIDTGQVTMNRWKADGESALQHLREVEDTEFGYIGESPAGNIIFEDVHHRLVSPHTTSQVTFSDTSGATLSYEGIVQRNPWQDIYNRFEAEVQLFTVQSIAVLWTLAGETPVIGVGASLEVWVGYPTPDAATAADHVDAWTTPVVTTDYTANSQADGLGSDLSASVSVAVSKMATVMKVTLTNNHATLPAYLTFLQARGTAAYKNDPIRIVQEDATSKTAYGTRTYPLPGKFYPSTVRAKSFGEYGTSRYKDPLPVLGLTFQANQSSGHMTQALTRDVSERITVIASATVMSGAQLGISRDFFIESVSHRYSLAGHWVSYELSDAFAGAGAYWVLGVSLLGNDTRLVV